MPLPRIATPWSLPPGKALANQAKGTWWVGFSQGSWDEETFLLVLVDPRPSQGSLEGGREAGRSEPEKDMWWERERKPEQTGEDSARPALRSCREPGTQEASCRHWKSPGKRLSPGTPSRSTALTTLDDLQGYKGRRRSWVKPPRLRNSSHSDRNDRPSRSYTTVCGPADRAQGAGPSSRCPWGKRPRVSSDCPQVSLGCWTLSPRPLPVMSLMLVHCPNVWTAGLGEALSALAGPATRRTCPGLRASRRNSGVWGQMRDLRMAHWGQPMSKASRSFCPEISAKRSQIFQQFSGK